MQMWFNENGPGPPPRGCPEPRAYARLYLTRGCLFPYSAHMPVCRHRNLCGVTSKQRPTSCPEPSKHVLPSAGKAFLALHFEAESDHLARKRRIGFNGFPVDLPKVPQIPS
eukprot:scaffold1345_cov581-Prasinococcus_capsulatus_cf.AAC.2